MMFSDDDVMMMLILTACTNEDVNDDDIYDLSGVGVNSNGNAKYSGSHEENDDEGDSNDDVLQSVSLLFLSKTSDCPKGQSEKCWCTIFSIPGSTHLEFTTFENPPLLVFVVS